MGMLKPRRQYGWAGSLREFLNTPNEVIIPSLEEHLLGLLGMGTSGLQSSAWEEELNLVQISLRELSIARQDILDWSVVFEYELPLEGGRRPDVIILGPESIYIFEFKQDHKIQRAALDQTAAYGRDISEYHSESHNKNVYSCLVPTRTKDLLYKEDSIQVLSPNRIAAFLDDTPRGASLELHSWLRGDYAPLPTLIAAAKMIFNHERLPAIKRAESLGVGKAVDRLNQISEDAKRDGQRTLAFVAGVPGAGKTLVGLQYVYETSHETGSAVFLSGNGPLVEVLSGALKSKVFVRDLHAYVKQYGLTDRIPPQHVVVFDEAQRAWDAAYMEFKGKSNLSEPEILISIGEKIPDWASLVGLIGHGQEINSGEEAGMEGWNGAVDSSAQSDWKIHTPPRYKEIFEGKDVTEHLELDLTKTLRSKQAEFLHDWVGNLLEGKLSSAARIADDMRTQSYPMFLTRDLEQAKQYIRNRYEGEPNSRYGILASAKDRILTTLGIPNSFQETKVLKFSRWYNSGLEDEKSCTRLDTVMTEFGCQGLELDMALVAWGDDYLWTGILWQARMARTRFPQQDQHQIRLNSYRVLLTRSRDGLIIYLPDLEKFNKTEEALLASGVRFLPGS
jgi:hypothetical protein